MCGRYTLSKPLKNNLTHFNLNKVKVDFRERFNIAPTQKAPVIVSKNSERTLQEMRWGLIPSWAKEQKTGWINARSETVHEKNAFKYSFKNRRCLIPADGFFEWKKTEKEKTPYYFYLKTREPLAFAGLWEERRSNSETTFSFCILTTTANTLVKECHHRMPVILAPDNYDAWLDMNSSADFLRSLGAPYSVLHMGSHEVSKIVNNPGNDQPECLLPV